MKNENAVVVPPEVKANPISDNLYEVLGIDKTADATEIRRAYRRASMKYHPDRNGGTDEAKTLFQKIKKAYDILSDRTQREYYDATGDKRPDADELMAQAKDLVSQVFMQVLQQFATGEASVEYSDPAASAKQFIMNNASQVRENRNAMQKAISKMEAMRKRFKFKDRAFEQSPVGVLLDMNIKNIKKNFTLAGLELDMLAKAVELAGEYSYKMDERPAFRAARFSFDDDNGGPRFIRTTL